jgi:hypothetical protein
MSLKHEIDEAIFAWLEAFARVGPRSVHAIVESACQYGCQIQSTRRSHLPAMHGLRAAERPLRYCGTRDRLALALRYSGSPPDVLSGFVNDVWIDVVRRRLVSYETIAAVLNCSPRAAQAAIAAARSRIRRALLEDSSPAIPPC